MKDVPKDLIVLIYDLADEREFYQIEFDVRNKDNDVLDRVTDWHQALGPEDEPDPPPPFVIRPTAETDTSIMVEWERPPTDMDIRYYIVYYQPRTEEDSLPGSIPTYVKCFS